ncbi:heterokaryon incompatibility protein-domain-containing protein [Camillea tinctor]|nr:heterokaryon incompatibility protein-domain-containing protein [Camillea tinctor]
MRLINTRTLEMKEFVGQIPPYAILSHTWGEDEVTLADYQAQEKRVKQDGFRKIQLTCQQAVEDGLEWAWVDTCCIDKSSSAELSEAINSMFRWYLSSAVCYAYLSDWPQLSKVDNSDKKLEEKFGGCRWFTRGWTLQELIAPPNLRFYADQSFTTDQSSCWQLIGDKKHLLSILEKVTKIPQHVLGLEDPVVLSRCTIAARMSWAAGRKTTREEDMAYCLMGLFGINMPMLYGEGRRAFLRLQDEIIKVYDDWTLFAWRSFDDRQSSRGILAVSPDEFAGSGNIRLVSNCNESEQPVTDG